MNCRDFHGSSRSPLSLACWKALSAQHLCISSLASPPTASFRGCCRVRVLKAPAFRGRRLAGCGIVSARKNVKRGKSSSKGRRGPEAPSPSNIPSPTAAFRECWHFFFLFWNVMSCTNAIADCFTRMEVLDLRPLESSFCPSQMSAQALPRHAFASPRRSTSLMQPNRSR